MKAVIPLVAAAAAVALVAAVVVGFTVLHHADAGPDPFAGSYPLVSPSPTPSTTSWRPSGPPAGPLPTYHGTPSRVAGRIVDRAAGLSYPRFAPPWHRKDGVNRTGEEIDSKTNDEKHFWYVAVYAGPLRADYDLPGPNRLRAAAELVAKEFGDADVEGGGTSKTIAGTAATIDHHPAWIAAVRVTEPPGMPGPMKWRTEVAVAVDTGRRHPGVVEVQVPGNQERLLPDIGAVVRSLRVVR